MDTETAALYTVTRLLPRHFISRIGEDIQILYRELSKEKEPPDVDIIGRSIPGVFVYIACTGNIENTENVQVVAMATLSISPPSLRGNRTGEVIDVATHPDHRGKGLMKMIFSILIKKVREEGLYRLQLTSRPSRKAANGLYRSLGFAKVAEATGSSSTNCYRLQLRQQ